MGDDDDGVTAGQLEHKLLHLTGRFDIERRAGLIHENDLRLEGQQAGDAEFLLLIKRKRRRPRLELVLEVSPQPDIRERLLNSLVEKSGRERLPGAVDAQAEDDVFIDRQWKRIGSLKDHPHALAQLDE